MVRVKRDQYIYIYIIKVKLFIGSTFIHNYSLFTVSSILWPNSRRVSEQGVVLELFGSHSIYFWYFTHNFSDESENNNKPWIRYKWFGLSPNHLTDIVWDNTILSFFKMICIKAMSSSSIRPTLITQAVIGSKIFNFDYIFQ